MDFCSVAVMEALVRRFDAPRNFDLKPLYKYLCPVIILVCFFSIICNAIIMGISRQSTVANKSPILLLSLNLALTDLITAFLNGLNILINSYLVEVFDWRTSNCRLLILEVCRCSALVASALHLLALAIVHYRGIVDPLHYRSSIFFTRHLSREINIVSLCCWLFPGIVFTALFFAFPCQGFRSETCNFQFLMAFKYRYTLFAMFTLPLLAMSAIYVRIFVLISRHQKGHRVQVSAEQAVVGGNIVSAASSPEAVVASTPVGRKCLACGAGVGVAAGGAAPVIVEEEDAGAGENDDDGEKDEAADDNEEQWLDAGRFKVQAESSSVAADGAEQSHQQSDESGGGARAAPEVGPKPAAADDQLLTDTASRQPLLGKQQKEDCLNKSAFRPPTKTTKKRTLRAQFSLGTNSSSSPAVRCSCEAAPDLSMAAAVRRKLFSRSASSIGIGRDSRRWFLSRSTQHQQPQQSPAKQPQNSQASTKKRLVVRSASYTNTINGRQTFESQRRHVHASAVPQTNTKALVTTLLILGTYFVSYVPTIVNQALTCIDHCPFPLYTVSYKWRVIVGSMSTILLIFKSIVDPLIYSYRMKEIQTAIRKYFSSRRSRSTRCTSFNTSQRFTHSNNNNQQNNINSNNNNSKSNNHKHAKHLHQHNSLKILTTTSTSANKSAVTEMQI